MGWDEEEFTDGRLPAKEDIDDLAPMNPVMLLGCAGTSRCRTAERWRCSGWVRFGARSTRDAGGALTGIIKEQGLDRAFAAVPRDSVETVMEGLVTVEYGAALKRPYDAPLYSFARWVPRGKLMRSSA